MSASQVLVAGVIIVLLGLYAVATVNLGIDPSVIKPQEFYKFSVMDALEALATVGTFGVAVWALITWWRPDDTRRRADTAQLISRQSAKVEGLLRRARIGMHAFHDDTHTITVADKQKAAESKVIPVDLLPDILAAVVELKVFRSEAKRLFEDKAILAGIDFLDAEGNAIANALRAVMSIRDQGPSMQKYPNAERAYDRIFADLNIKLMKKSEWPGPGVDPDERDKTLIARGEALRDALAKYLLQGR